MSETYEDIISSYSSYVDDELARFLSLSKFLDVIKLSSRSDLDNSNISTLAALAQQEANTKISVTPPEDELSPLIKELLKTTLSPSTNPLEEAYNEILEVIGINFLLNQNSIFYVAQVVARRIIALITFESTMLNAIKTLIDDLDKILDYRQATGTELMDKRVAQDRSDFYAKKLEDSIGYIDKISNSVLIGKLNVTALNEYKKIIDGVLEQDNIDLAINYSDPSAVFKKILTRLAYAGELHKKIIALKDQWIKILDEYVALEIQRLFAQRVLDNVNNKNEYWKMFFTKTGDEAKFVHLRDLLVYLTTSKKVTETILSPPSPQGDIIINSSTEWIDDGDGDDYSQFIRSVGDLTTGDVIAIDSPTLTTDNFSVTGHVVLGTSIDYVWVDPEIKRPPTDNYLINYVKVEGGGAYYGKYESLKSFLENFEIPATLDLAPNHSTTYSSLRRDIGDVVWSYLNNKKGTVTTDIYQNFNNKKHTVDATIDGILAKLNIIQTMLVGFSLPQLKDIDNIDDVLQSHGLDIQRESFISGRIKEFFEHTLYTSSTPMSLITKINTLVKEL